MGIFDATSIPSSPTGQTTQTSNISPWAQPYISDYLTKAQSLIANQQTPELLGQSYIEAKNLQLPGGFASGASLAQAGGQGALSTAPIALQYGQRGAEYGQQGTKYGEMGAAMGQIAARAGDIYGQQATSPAAIQAYMSPYMQDVVDYQKSQAIRDFAKQTPALKAQAVGQGAFGGSRQAIMQAEAQRGLQNQLQGIEALGRQQAFQQAQQAQQFGANLGLQGQQVGMQGQQLGLAGLGTAMQGQQIGLQGVGGAQQGYAGATQAGGTLGNIAAQEAQARLAALQLKYQMGLQQQQWPYQQLQFQQGMMSGLPIGTSTQQIFQAPPSPLSQMIGLGSTVVGGIGALNKAGAFDAAKNWWNSSGSLPNYMDARDIGLAETSLSGASAADLPYDLIAKGGHIKDGRVKRYADGGDVQSVGMDGLGIGKFEQDQIDALNRGNANPLVDGVYAPNLPSRPNTLMPAGAAPQTAGMLAGRVRMSPEAASAIGGGLRGLMPMPAQQPDNSAYLNSLYSGLLGRQADQAGFQHNLGLLNSGAISQQDLANAFLASKEYEGMPRREYQLMGAGLSGAGRNAISAAMNPLTQLRPTEQENYTGFGPTAGGPLNQIRLSDQENYTGIGPTRSGLTDIRLNQLLGFR